ncbi:MAG: hypothetical protein JNN12_10970 [Bacteroidetes Order II. Incertae sedis bacterium]|nr:hypothetical protein [Bacteroidetes Order II. bacterium]
MLQNLLPEVAYVSPTLLIPAATHKPKHVAIAFLASAVVPGAGQVYNRQFVKSGVFFGAEITSIVLQQKWQQEGNQQYALVKQTAHRGWSIIRYAEWLNKFSGYAGPKIPISSTIRQIDLTNPAKWTDSERQTVRELFNAVRAAEDQSKNPKTGAAFSHKIPFFGEQQYYELVGKYYQYSPGWPDYNGADDPDEKVEGVYVNASAQFLAYAQSHGASQAQLRKASRTSTLIVLNHFISAFEAGISARLHNRKISATPVAMFTDSGDWVPALTMSFKW